MIQNTKKSYLFKLIALLLLVSTSWATPLEEEHKGQVVEAPKIDPQVKDVPIAKLINRFGQETTITERELKAAFAIAPQGASLRSVLDQLIELSILSEEAQRKGFDTHPRAHDELIRAATRHFITDDFEQSYTVDTLPLRFVEKATQQNIGLFRHPELRRANHLLLKPISLEKTEINKEQTELLRPFAERAAEELKRDPPGDSLALKAKLAIFQSWLPEGYEVIYEELGRFSRQGPYVKSFTEPCFEIQELPQLIGPILTPFGFHFIWVAEIIPSMDTPDAEIDRAVRERILPEVRAYEWGKLLSTLLQAAQE